MDVIVPLRERANLETLNASVASILQHTEFRIVVIGADPRLATVAHVPTRQTRGDKFRNQELAMRTALDDDAISDPFIWSNDDILWTRPASPIRWALGQLADDRRGNVYGQRKRTTANILQRLGLPTYDYESHTPLPVDKQGMLNALTHCATGGTMRSLYGNLTGLPDRIAPDVKIRSRHDAVPDTEWISVANAALIPKHPA